MYRIFLLIQIFLILFCTSENTGTISETESGIAIIGTTQDSTIKPLKDINVFLRNYGNSISYDTVTDDNGKYYFKEVPRDNYYVVLKGKTIGALDTITINESNDDTVNILNTLYPYGQLSGFIDSSLFATLSNAQIVIVELGLKIDIDENGSFIDSTIPKWDDYTINIIDNDTIVEEAITDISVTVESGKETGVINLGSDNGREIFIAKDYSTTKDTLIDTTKSVINIIDTLLTIIDLEIEKDSTKIQIDTLDNNIIIGTFYDTIVVIDTTALDTSYDTIKVNMFPTDSLVAYFPFKKNASDSSGNGLDGTIMGQTITSDRYGNDSSAYQFYGNVNGEGSDKIELKDHAASFPKDSFAIAVWYNKTDNVTAGTLVYWGDIYASGNRLVSLDIADTTITTWQVNLSYYGNDLLIECDSASGQWNFIVATFNGSERKVYLNGTLIGEDTSTPLNMPNTNEAEIGNRESGREYEGIIDDVWIYSRTLSQIEITNMYNATKP